MNKNSKASKNWNLIIGKKTKKYGNNYISTTKYTYWNFLPKNLIEQFSKLANIYFVVLIILQTIPEITISNRIPTILPPLLIILMISGAKDFFEDFKRNKSDNFENRSETLIYRKGLFEIIKWKDLMVGKIIKIEKNQSIPADILLLLTDKNGKCFIETKNLDGETNLKKKEVNISIQEIVNLEEDLVDIKKKEFFYEKPNENLYQFTGSLYIDNKPIPIDINNILLRGSVLKNTDFIIGLVIYNGHYNKILLNTLNVRPKNSLLEQQTNRYILVIFAILQFFCLIASFLYIIWLNNNIKDFKEMIGEIKIEISSREFFTRYGNWILIFGNFVPISLLITIEGVKFFQGILISYNKDLKSKIDHANCTVQNSNLNEELGQINFIFTDKTGTLTCNNMLFKKLILNDKTFGKKYDNKLDLSKFKKVTNVDFRDKDFIDLVTNKDSKALKFIKFLSLCHSIIIENYNDTIKYNANSPDELALVNFAKFLGSEFLGINELGYTEINFWNKKERFKVHYILEFNSQRKRMSIILEDKKGKIILLTKGADNIIIPRCTKIPDKFIKKLNKLANEGLRTWVLAIKIIPIENFSKWKKAYENARIDLDNKVKKMIDLQEEIETNLSIVGATAIEDQLQDEVNECIAQFKTAGIKVWVLTGDKVETAKSLGFSCNILQKDMIIRELTSKNKNKILQDLRIYIEEFETWIKDKRKALIISGESLIHIMNNKSLTKSLNRIALLCEAFLCCRVSPKQKSEVVKMVRKNLPLVRTLSIGDGSNDVNMIISSHIGIGIRGKEGQQASSSSDYSIGEFKHLRYLLFVYGREFYRKNTILIMYNFYKNIVLVLPQWIYAIIFENFSGITLYDSILYQLPNIMFTSFPIILFAIFDKNKKVVDFEKKPEYYKPGLKRLFSNFNIFLFWFIKGCTQAFLITILAFLIDITPDYNGNLIYFRGYSMLIFNFTILIPNLKIFIISNSYYFLNIFIIISSYILYIFTFLIINYIRSNENYFLFPQLFFSLRNIIIIILIIISIVGIDYLFESALKILFYDKSNIEELIIEKKNKKSKNSINIKPINKLNKIFPLNSTKLNKLKEIKIIKTNINKNFENLEEEILESVNEINDINNKNDLIDIKDTVENKFLPIKDNKFIQNNNEINEDIIDNNIVIPVKDDENKSVVKKKKNKKRKKLENSDWSSDESINKITEINKNSKLNKSVKKKKKMKKKKKVKKE